MASSYYANASNGLHPPTFPPPPGSGSSSSGDDGRGSSSSDALRSDSSFATSTTTATHSSGAGNVVDWSTRSPNRLPPPPPLPVFPPPAAPFARSDGRTPSPVSPTSPTSSSGGGGMKLPSFLRRKSSKPALLAKDKSKSTPDLKKSAKLQKAGGILGTGKTAAPVGESYGGGTTGGEVGSFAGQADKPTPTTAVEQSSNGVGLAPFGQTAAELGLLTGLDNLGHGHGGEGAPSSSPVKSAHPLSATLPPSFSSPSRPSTITLVSSSPRRSSVIGLENQDAGGKRWSSPPRVDVRAGIGAGSPIGSLSPTRLGPDRQGSPIKRSTLASSVDLGELEGFRTAPTSPTYPHPPGTPSRASTSLQQAIELSNGSPASAHSPNRTPKATRQPSYQSPTPTGAQQPQPQGEDMLFAQRRQPNPAPVSPPHVANHALPPGHMTPSQRFAGTSTLNLSGAASSPSAPAFPASPSSPSYGSPSSPARNYASRQPPVVPQAGSLPPGAGHAAMQPLPSAAPAPARPATLTKSSTKRSFFGFGGGKDKKQKEKDKAGKAALQKQKPSVPPQLAEPRRLRDSFSSGQMLNAVVPIVHADEIRPTSPIGMNGGDNGVPRPTLSGQNRPDRPANRPSSWMVLNGADESDAGPPQKFGVGELGRPFAPAVGYRDDSQSSDDHHFQPQRAMSPQFYDPRAVSSPPTSDDGHANGRGFAADAGSEEGEQVSSNGHGPRMMSFGAAVEGDPTMNQETLKHVLGGYQMPYRPGTESSDEDGLRPPTVFGSALQSSRSSSAAPSPSAPASSMGHSAEGETKAPLASSTTSASGYSPLAAFLGRATNLVSPGTSATPSPAAEGPSTPAEVKESPAEELDLMNASKPNRLSMLFNRSQTPSLPPSPTVAQTPPKTTAATASASAPQEGNAATWPTSSNHLVVGDRSWPAQEQRSASGASGASGASDFDVLRNYAGQESPAMSGAPLATGLSAAHPADFETSATSTPESEPQPLVAAALDEQGAHTRASGLAASAPAPARSSPPSRIPVRTWAGNLGRSLPGSGLFAAVATAEQRSESVSSGSTGATSPSGSASAFGSGSGAHSADAEGSPNTKASSQWSGGVASKSRLEEAAEIDDGEQVEELEEVEEEEVEEEPLCKGNPRFEHALLTFPYTILLNIISQLDYLDFHSLPQLSRTMRTGLGKGDPREVVMDRYFGDLGYRIIPTTTSISQVPESNELKQSAGRRAPGMTNPALASIPRGAKLGQASHHAPSSSHGSSILSHTDAPKRPGIELTLHDLHAYYTGLEFAPGELPALARQLKREGVDLPTVRMIRASTRAHNKLVIRVRQQPAHLSDSRKRLSPPRYDARGRRIPPMPSIFRAGRAAMLKVWVPAKQSWMNDEELVECEREVWRSETWGHIKRGDVVLNTAVGDFGNEGKLIHDGKYLRDLQYVYDAVGHVPSWLNMLTISPAFYHNIIASSTPNPVVYLDLTSFLAQVQETLTLCQDKVEVASPQGRYRVQRWVYRAAIKVKPGAMIGGSGGAGGAGPGGIEVVHADWAGQIIIESEGASEHARDLVVRCTRHDLKGLPTHRMSAQEIAHAKEQARQAQLTPWRILRERSRPGKLWIKPVYDDERI